MDIVIKNVRILGSELASLIIRNGIIEAVGSNLAVPEGMPVWEPGGNAWVSPGWFDAGVQGCDPGFEHREDLSSVVQAAAVGGFTGIAVLPNTLPPLHSKAEVLYVRNKTAHEAVKVWPIGAISSEIAGKNLAELYDMASAGAIAFTDGALPVQDVGLLLRALDYARAFDGLVINAPHHKTLASGGQVHEGLMSTQLGMKGIPALAEEVMVQRDISLLEYSGGRLHLHVVSTAKSVELIRKAKRSGLRLSASVAAANICFTDEQLADFDAQWKLMPPLRSENDRQALIEGLLDGTLDFICSNHSPWDEEAKNLEFPYAEFGMSAIETVFAICRTIVGNQIPLEILIEKISKGPREVLGIPMPVIQPGHQAELTIFDPEGTFVFQQTRSRSRNNPFLGMELTGKILGIVAGGQLVKN